MRYVVIRVVLHAHPLHLCHFRVAPVILTRLNFMSGIYLYHQWALSKSSWKSLRQRRTRAWPRHSVIASGIHSIEITSITMSLQRLVMFSPLTSANLSECSRTFTAERALPDWLLAPCPLRGAPPQFVMTMRGGFWLQEMAIDQELSGSIAPTYFP